MASDGTVPPSSPTVRSMTGAGSTETIGTGMDGMRVLTDRQFRDGDLDGLGYMQRNLVSRKHLGKRGNISIYQPLGIRAQYVGKSWIVQQWSGHLGLLGPSCPYA